MEKLLNFAEPLDVDLLDQVVYAFYANPQKGSAAQQLLTAFQEHPDSWTRVATILEKSKLPNTKYLALQILEMAIKTRWKILPREECEGIKNYIVNLIIKLSSDKSSLEKEKLLMGKLDVVLVQIIKKEWPKNWESFIPEIVGASRSNESLCENNMTILKLMSEEVFDFSSGQLTQIKAKELKESFNKEFSLVFQLCEFVLANSQSLSLLLATLETLLKFLSWIPLGYIFETQLIETLVFKFFPVSSLRNVTLECLTEVAGLSAVKNDAFFEKMYVAFIQQLEKMLPATTDIAAAYEKAGEQDENFIRQLSLFFTTFFKSHLKTVEKKEVYPLVLQGHLYLANISLVPDDEIFKICLEYWNTIATDLYHEQVPPDPFSNLNNPWGLTANATSPLLLGNNKAELPSRKEIYSQILSRVRVVMIKKMPRPEEVLIVEEEGEIVRETMKDTAAITLYKSMKETLVILTHLDYEDTQSIMLDKLESQVNGREWSWNNLNTLCWAIGAISGAQSEESEKRFIVTVIKELLGMCEAKRGKDNKAVVASNIMYVVGQYPRFLRAHWKFLKTVVNKLFEFMHETHPGVQDMACDTFLKISQKCRRKFVTLQTAERFPFIEEIIQTLPDIIAELQNSQIQTFYEALGCIVSAQVDTKTRGVLLASMMSMPNQSWSDIMQQAGQNIDYLKQPETSKSIETILKTNIRACFSLGASFVPQLSRIYLDMLNVYKVYSGMISSAVAQNGAHVTNSSIIRSMRAVKKQVLKLIETFVEKSENPQTVCANFIPPLLESVLGDYKSNVPDARDPEVLSLIAMIINRMQGTMTKDVGRIFEHTFQCTLEMITKNFSDYPEHRIHFFTLLRAVNNHCFPAFFSLSSSDFKLVVDSIVWAFKHTERNISETGLNILLELLKNVANAGADVSSHFFKAYFLSLLQDVLFVLTDGFHRSGFKLQSTILLFMFTVVESASIKVPLWDASTLQDPSMTNNKFLRIFVVNLLASGFKNLTENQVQVFVSGLFDMVKDATLFKNRLRDFLISLKEFSSGDNEELFLEEKEAAAIAAREAELKRQSAIPGLLPIGIPEDMND